jgi:hypothetical protein
VSQLPVNLVLTPVSSKSGTWFGPCNEVMITFA